MKKFIGYFIKYPIAVNIFIIGFLIFGYLGYHKMNSSIFPLSEASIIQISMSYPGASPEEVEEGVVQKIERNLKGVEGVDRITSTSQENQGNISIEVHTDFDINLVLEDVKNAVDKIPSFPIGTEPAVIETIKPTRAAISYALTGKETPMHILKSEAQNIENDLLRIGGISQIKLFGFPEEEIEISISEEKLRSNNLSFEEVSIAIAEANILISGGSIKTTQEEYLIRAKNKSYYSKNLEDIIVKTTASGGKVRLREIAILKDIFAEAPQYLTINGQPAISIEVTNTNSEDLISSADNIKKYCQKYNETHDNLELILTTDSSEIIQDRISLLLENAAVGMLLVLVLLSFFLRPRVAFWVAFGLPISFFGMFILLPHYDVTINMLSLFGMILVIGILVDDSIVIAENIYARVENGDSPIKAAVLGTKDVIVPIVAAITTTILAFSVFFFLDGQIGAFFGDIATVVALTLSVSLIEALLILPAHLAHSRDLADRGKTYKFNKWGDQFMGFMRDRLYSPALRFTLKNKFLSIAIVCFLFLMTLGAFAGGIIKLTFFPTNASDQIIISIQTPQGTSEHITDSLATHIEHKIWEVNEELEDTNSTTSHIINTLKQIGPGSAVSTIVVNLSPSETRTLSSVDISGFIRNKVGYIPEIEKLSYNSGSNVGGSPISISLQGDNVAHLKNAKDIIYQELGKNPDVKDIIDTSPLGIKEIQLELKDNASLMGLSLNDVMGQVRNAFFGKEVQRVQRGQDEVKVWVRYTKDNRSSINDLDNMQIRTQNGRVSLSEIATYKITRGDVSINHLEGIREITIEADLANTTASAPEIMQDLTTRIAKQVQDIYPGISISSEGQNREVDKIASSALDVIPAIIFLIYVVIVFAFRSYSQPFILLTLIPFSIIGVAWGHWLHGFSVNILSYLGIIGLVGIIVNDGLVFTGKFNSLLKQGLPFDEALYETGRARFRAIFLTSITTIAGLAPLMLEKSLQAQFLIPMAISIAYGIAIATVLTLFILPVFLSFSNSLKVNIKYLTTGKKPSKESVERAIIELKVEDEEF